MITQQHVTPVSSDANIEWWH